MEDNRIYSVAGVDRPTHFYSETNYALLQLGTKYHNTISGAAVAMNKYVNREINSAHVDPTRTKDNRILIGTGSVDKDLKAYMEDVTLRKNNVVCREIILSASGFWFHNKTYKDIYKWADVNKKFVLETFGDNARLLILHLDEQVPHLHLIIIPKHKTVIRGKEYNTLSGHRYYGGRYKIIEMHNNYAKAMQKEFPDLKRGVEGRITPHTNIKKLYGLLTSGKDTDIEAMKVRANYVELLEIRFKALNKTIDKMKAQIDRYKQGNEILKENKLEIEAKLNSKEKEINIIESTLRHLVMLKKIDNTEVNEIKNYYTGIEENKISKEMQNKLNLLDIQIKDMERGHQI